MEKNFDPLKPLEDVKIKLSEEQLVEIVEWFDDHSKPLLIINQDVEPTKVITVLQLKNFFRLRKFHRRSFHYPTYSEIMNEIEFLHMEANKMLTKDQLIYLLNKCVVDIDMRHELKLAFQLFDTEKRDYLDIDIMQELLTTQANAFDEDEIIEFLRDVNVRGDGHILYNNFVDHMFSNAHELNNLEKEYLYLDPDEDPSVPPEPEPDSDDELPPEPPPPPPSEIDGDPNNDQEE